MPARMLKCAVLAILAFCMFSAEAGEPEDALVRWVRQCGGTVSLLYQNFQNHSEETSIYEP
jgi:hypothetical protein